MRRLTAAFLYFFLAAPAVLSYAQSTTPWTIPEIFGVADPTGHSPKNITWAPDGSRATWLADNGDLMQVDAADGSLSKLIDHAKLSSIMNANLSEQDKDHRARYGQSNYIWAPDARHLLFDTNGELWYYDLRTHTGVEAGNSGSGSGDDPKFSPDGKSISYLRDHNLYVIPMQDHTAPLALTSTRESTMLNGQVDWVYDEELDVRSNYFWSPDSRQIAYLQMNEAAVPQYPITDWIPIHSTVEEQRYPQPGDANPSVRVGVVSAKGGGTKWLKIPLDAGNDYIPRFGWVDPKTLWVETLARDHKKMDLYFADVHSGDVKLVLAQTDPKYFTIAYDVNFDRPGEFLILSWRDGYRHIYRYTFDASNPLSSEAQLTKELENGNYEVLSLQGVDPAAKTVYYVSNEGDSREHQIWAVKLDGTDKHQVSTTKGVHGPDFAPDSSTYIDTTSSRMTPPELSFCTVPRGCKPLWQAEPIKEHELIAPQLLTLNAADGATTLYGSLILPPHETSSASVPLIVNPYGGPGVGAERDAWGGKSYLFDVLLAEHGFAVLHVDNRGMADRGREFEQAAYHDFGKVQLADQLAAIDQVLAKYPQLDKNRLGWWGWSWGGTFTLNAMTHSDRFRAGVSVAPVTDFRNYDSIYTERYLGLPADNPEVYDEAAVVNSAKNLKGHLLLVQGTGDDNVHFQNSIQFIQKLIDADLPYDLQVYPRKTHSIAGTTTQVHLFNRILAQFEMYLK